MVMKAQPTVEQDLECLARAAEEDRDRTYWTANREHAEQLAWEFRNPTAKSLIENVPLVLDAINRPDVRVWQAASRLQKLIDAHTEAELAALFRAA